MNQSESTTQYQPPVEKKQIKKANALDPDCKSYGPKIRIATEVSLSPWAIRNAVNISREAVALIFILFIKALNEWQ